MINSTKGLLVDTGFFYAFYDERDAYHNDARKKAEWLDFFPIVLPWPVLYETVNTRFSRRTNVMNQFHLIVSSPSAILLDDSPYRGGAYQAVLRHTRSGSPLSLVDAILRAVIEDANVALEAMLTFNARDFADVCARYSVEVL